MVQQRRSPPDSTELPLSEAQRAIWLDLQLHSGKAEFYNITEYVEIAGAVDAVLLERALRFVVSKSAALRVRIALRGQEPFQIVRADLDCSVRHIDLRTAEAAEAEAMAFMQEQRRRCLDLYGEELVRFAILRLTPEKTYLHSHFHHLVIDGFGQAVFREHVTEAYTALANDRVPKLRDDLSMYADYVDSGRRYRNSPDYASDREYWATQSYAVASSLSVHKKPIGLRDPALETSILYFDVGTAERLRELAARQQMGVPQLLVCAAILFLERTTRSRDIVIGLPTHGRLEKWMRELLATCSNVLPVAFSVDADRTITECLHRVHARLREVLAHKRHRYDDIRRAQKTKVGAADRFNVVINAVPFPGALSFADFPARSHGLTSNYVADLAIWFFTNNAGAVGVKLDANPRKYERWEIDNHFQTLLAFLRAIALDAARPLSQIALIDSAEIERLSGAGSRAPDAESAPSLQRLVETRVDKVPHAVAAIWGERVLSYLELDQRANRFASSLRDSGVARGDVVAVLIERSFELLAAVLGVLKSGAAYLPLESGYPVQRLRYILEEADPKVVLASGAFEAHAALAGRNLLRIEDAQANGSATRVENRTAPIDAAYCIYTSGSTGRPKGVVVEHRNAINHVTAATRAFALTAADRVLQFSSASFDAWLEEVFPTWTAGATLVLQPEKVLPAQAFGELVNGQRISVLNLPVAYWRTWVAELTRTRRPPPASLRLVVIGGEKVLPDTREEWMKLPGADGIELVNTYGPTEATVTSTLHRIDSADSDRDVPIGRPIANARTYILNERLLPVPVGVVGELCIAGAGVARGYLKDEALTAQRFVSWKHGKFGERIYRSGDLARFRADGAIEFIGRIDHQVKINGYRVELGEIESLLSQHEAVVQCAVVVQSSERRLLAYVVPRAGGRLDTGELRRFLALELPDYMLPSEFIFLAMLPLTPTGKIDRTALSAQPVSAERSSPFTAPRTELERRIVCIWSEALHIEHVGVDQDFVELGGDSLTALYVLSRLLETFPIGPTLPMLFQARTVEKLAEILAKL